MFNKEVIGKMKRGAYLVNNARGAICDTQAVVEALESGHLAGCAFNALVPALLKPWVAYPALQHLQCGLPCITPICSFNFKSVGSLAECCSTLFEHPHC